LVRSFDETNRCGTRGAEDDTGNGSIDGIGNRRSAVQANDASGIGTERGREEQAVADEVVGDSHEESETFRRRRRSGQEGEKTDDPRGVVDVKTIVVHKANEQVVRDRGDESSQVHAPEFGKAPFAGGTEEERGSVRGSRDDETGVS
jgi:hypothetical protein